MPYYRKKVHDRNLKRWRAKVTRFGVTYELGLYATREEAEYAERRFKIREGIPLDPKAARGEAISEYRRVQRLIEG